LGNIVKLLDDVRHRYIAFATLFNDEVSQVMTDVRILVDTGAFNTMIDSALANKFGILLPEKMTVSIGGKIVDTQFCIIRNLAIDGHNLTRVFALACPFDNWLMGHILLGTNVLNNWEFSISRSRDVLEFSEKVPTDAPNKKHPYQNYFKDGSYIAVQDDVISKITTI
jgi:hypothetical protein